MLEDILVDIARDLHQRTGLPDLCLGGGVALNGVANARILRGIRLRAAVRAARARRCRLRARRRALFADRIHFGNPDRDVPGPPLLGARRSTARRSRGSPGRTACRSRPSTTRALIDETADDLAAGQHRRLDGRALRVRPARARPPQPARRAARRGDARPAQPRHQISRGVPPVRAGRARARMRTPSSSCRRAARGSRASCRACSRCGREWRERLAAITHVDGTARVQTLDARLRAAALRPARRPMATAPACRCCSTPRSTSPASRSSAPPRRAIRPSAAAAIDLLVAGNTRVRKRARGPRRPREEEVA